jgi:predicted transcriptional regulator
MTSDLEQNAGEAAGDRIVALSRDLFFGMRVRTVVRQLGYDLALVNDESKMLAALDEGEAVLTLIDFNQPVDWDSLKELLEGPVPVLAFGSHTDVEGFRIAKAAGVTRVVSNGDFSRRLPELVDQYRRQ